MKRFFKNNEAFGVCTLVSNQARRAVVVKQINLLKNYCNVLIGSNRVSFVRSFKDKRGSFCCLPFLDIKGSYVLGGPTHLRCAPPARTPVLHSPAPPCPAVLLCAVPLQTPGKSGFCIRKNRSTSSQEKQFYLFVLVFRVSCVDYTCRVQNLHLSRPYRVRAHSRVPVRGRSGLDADKTVDPGNKRSSYSARHGGHNA